MDCARSLWFVLFSVLITMTRQLPFVVLWHWFVFAQLPRDCCRCQIVSLLHFDSACARALLVARHLCVHNCEFIAIISMRRSLAVMWPFQIVWSCICIFVVCGFLSNASMNVNSNCRLRARRSARSLIWMMWARIDVESRVYVFNYTSVWHHQFQ